MHSYTSTEQAEITQAYALVAALANGSGEEKLQNILLACPNHHRTHVVIPLDHLPSEIVQEHHKRLTTALDQAFGDHEGVECSLHHLSIPRRFFNAVEEHQISTLVEALKPIFISNKDICDQLQCLKDITQTHDGASQKNYEVSMVCDDGKPRFEITRLFNHDHDASHAEKISLKKLATALNNSFGKDIFVPHNYSSRILGFFSKRESFGVTITSENVSQLLLHPTPREKVKAVFADPFYFCTHNKPQGAIGHEAISVFDGLNHPATFGSSRSMH